MIATLQHVQLSILSICAGVGVQNERPVVVSFSDQSALQAELATQELLASLASSEDSEKTSEFRYVHVQG